MLLHTAKHFWLRNKRRLADPAGVLERRWFREVRREFYDWLWPDAASAIGARVTSHPGGLIQITRGGLATFVDQSNLMLDSVMTARMVANKALTYRLMAAKGLRIPQRCEFDLETLGKAEAFMHAQEGPVVVKPADGTAGGYGVTTNIVTTPALHAASWNAAGFHADNASLLAEEQISGHAFRLLFLDGEFLDAIRRDPPVVIGDGKSTIRQLAARENRARRMERPFSALYPLMIDQESRNALAAQGKSPDMVPAAGEVVRVKLAVNENASAQNHVVRDEVHPAIVDAASRLVIDLGVGFAGVDLTAGDISLPLEEADPIFNEINTAPGIHHHYLVSQPDRAANVAPLILDRMFTTRRGVIQL